MQKTEGYEELLWLKNGAVDTRKHRYRRQARPMLRQEYRLKCMFNCAAM